MKRLLLLTFAMLSLSPFAQTADVAVVGGLGGSGDEDENVHRTGIVGVTAGWPFSSRHRIQFDYMFSDINTRQYNRHFVTGSYVVQGTSGGARSFFQVGGGVTRKNWTDSLNSPAGKADAVLLLGGGVTIDLKRSLFLRPHIRLYAAPGSNITILPVIALGLRV